MYATSNEYHYSVVIFKLSINCYNSEQTSRVLNVANSTRCQGCGFQSLRISSCDHILQSDWAARIPAAGDTLLLGMTPALRARVAGTARLYWTVVQMM